MVRPAITLLCPGELGELPTVGLVGSESGGNFKARFRQLVDSVEPRTYVLQELDGLSVISTAPVVMIFLNSTTLELCGTGNAVGIMGEVWVQIRAGPHVLIEQDALVIHSPRLDIGEG